MTPTAPRAELSMPRSAHEWLRTRVAQHTSGSAHEWQGHLVPGAGSCRPGAANPGAGCQGLCRGVLGQCRGHRGPCRGRRGASAAPCSAAAQMSGPGPARSKQNSSAASHFPAAAAKNSKCRAVPAAGPRAPRRAGLGPGGDTGCPREPPPALSPPRAPSCPFLQVRESGKAGPTLVGRRRVQAGAG